MAENKNENQQSQEMLDKTYVVEGFDPSKLQNADVNLSQYWDDSSEANYNNPSLWGGENTKYTGENTLGSQVAYNPNATVEGLDPNYLYWQEAQMQNSKEANYIAKRNDEIASALYNAWKTSIQDVNDFLDSQRGFYNSVWNERANTVTAVWKRIGQIAKQNEKSDEPQADPNKTPDEWNNDALNNMQSDLNKSTAWELYGKVTADQDTHIKTLEDENSVYKSMNESRITSLKNLLAMSDESIASAIISNAMSSDGQVMRDLMQYAPEKYEAVKLAEKKIRGQMTIDAITKWEEINSTAVDTTNTDTELTTYAVSNATNSTSATQLLKSIDSILSSNQTAQSAQELMQSIEEDMAKLKSRLRNLKGEANRVFKWDVPQYIVNAYIANRTQEIQDNMQILEDRYNAAYSRYQTEAQQAQWEAEFNLKKEQFQLEKDEFEWKKDNTETTTSGGSSSYGSYRTERNNNPTAMITAYAKELGGVLWEDYEIGDSFIWTDKNWNPITLYTARLIGDPVEKTIELLDRWLANGMPNIFKWWTYASELWLNNNVWRNATEGEKRKIIEKMLKREWGNMAKMSYYRQTFSDDTKWSRWDWRTFDLTSSETYNNLSARDKDGVKAMLNLQMSATKLLARKNDYDSPSLIMNAVTQINPQWTEDDIWQANKYKTNWNKWMEWGWLDRAATAWDYAKQLYDYMEEIWDEEWDSIAKELYETMGIQNIVDLSSKEKELLSQLWDTRIVKLKQIIDNLVAEYAGAMKWWSASLGWEEVVSRSGAFPLWFTKNQMQTAAITTAEAVYYKVVTSAQQYKNVVMQKPDPIWLTHWGLNDWDAVADWIASLRPTMSYYFNYTPWGWNAPRENYEWVDILAQYDL